MDFFYMPTKVIFEDNVISNFGQEFSQFGHKCLIVTGRTSAIKSGALEDLTRTFEAVGIDYEIFNEIMENPTVEIIQKAADTYKDFAIDFIVGIGGGSPLDASKMIGVLLLNQDMTARDLLTKGNVISLPIIAVPTTSGTGSETTPYSIITDHESETKITGAPKIFPHLSLLDVKYFMTMPLSVVKSTSVDALSHLTEGFLVKNSNVYSDQLAISGLKFFVKAMDDLKAENFTRDMHINLIHASTIAGMVISHTGTGIPHGMGYNLTYKHQVLHGKATALFLASMVELHISKDHELKKKAYEYLEIMGMKSPSELREFIWDLVGTFEISQEDFDEYVLKESQNKRKLDAHSFEITYEDMKKAFKESLILK